MTPERWQQVEEVFQAALDRAPGERAAFLQQACGGDAELQTEAGSLVDAHESASDFIEVPAMAHDARVILADCKGHVGDEIGPYQVIQQLGSGGMGEVYLAQDTRLDRQVALKILPAYFVSHDDRLRRFQREARAVSALNHPNILTIHEVGEIKGVHFIATEFIDGPTLRELMAAGSLSLTEVLEVSAQVATALSAAHAAGIVHRDIKPENIMRRSDGLVKVLDFGIAKLLEQTPAGLSAITGTQTEMGAVLGTVGYMSPEQARGLEVDERTDIWSLGVVLYEMLAQRPPFSGATRMDTMVAVLERAPAPLSALSEDPGLQTLRGVVNQTLRKEAAERYQTAADLLSDITTAKQQLATVDIAKQQRVLGLLREPSLFEHNAVSSSSIREVTSSLPLAPGASRGYRRYGLLVLGLVMLAAIALGGVSLYRRLRSPTGSSSTGTVPASTTANKLYSQMSSAEQFQFVDEQEQRISAMMGDRPAKLNEEAVRAIKTHVDRYSARQTSVSNKPGEESLSVIYARAVPLVPLIAKTFAARKIPIVVGLYLPMIESGYQPCSENSWGAKGLFQFLPATAKSYGVAPEEMCDVDKMTPAAAHYIADRMAELGEDSEAMTLVLLSYNRGPQWVVDTLRQLRETDNYERNFWTLYAHREQLDDQFRNENAAYVPAFFAAAIVGENPRNFGLGTPPLSTLAPR